jgi:hypothetical protein
MSKMTLTVIVGLLSMACSVHRVAQVNEPCRPTAIPLTVESGAVVITCREEGDDTNWFQCTISPVGQGPLLKTGIFMFSDTGLASGFNPNDSNAYASWDGCSVHLQDGRVLEPVTVISSNSDVPVRAKRKP